MLGDNGGDTTWFLMLNPEVKTSLEVVLRFFRSGWRSFSSQSSPISSVLFKSAGTLTLAMLLIYWGIKKDNDFKIKEQKIFKYNF